MIKLDDNLLAELGLHALPVEEKKNLLRHIYETLEMRVGTTLAQQMTDAQLDEFENFINNNDEAGALHWLETNFPNYKDVVAYEFEKLKNEVRQAAPQILASIASQPQQITAQQYQQSIASPAPVEPQFDPAMYQNQSLPQQQGDFAQTRPPVVYQQQPQQPMQPPLQQPQYQQPQPPPTYQSQQRPTQDQFDQAA